MLAEMRPLPQGLHLDRLLLRAREQMRRGLAVRHLPQGDKNNKP